MRPVRALPAALVPLLMTLSAAAGLGVPPRYTRDQMEGSLGESARWCVVYGTLDPAATPVLRERALQLARRWFGGDSSAVLADRDTRDAVLAGANVAVFGGPAQNALARRLAPALPVRFTARGFVWAGTAYERPGDVLHLVYPSPLDPHHFLLLTAGNSAGALGRRGTGFGFGSEDWRIVRDGDLARSGRFAQSPGAPWRYDPALDRDRERERERFAAALRTAGGGALRVRGPAGTDLDAARATGERTLAALDRLGLRAPRGAPPVTLTLYASIEQKGLMVRDTRPGSVDASGDGHAAPVAGRTDVEGWPVAAARLVALGAPADAALLEPAGVWLADRTAGEPLAVAVARAYAARLLPSAGTVLARAPWRSPLQSVPAQAVLLRALAECAGARARVAVLAALVAEPPGTLDSLCAAAGVSPRAVERRYASLADSLGRAGAAAARAAAPRGWRPGQGFMRGVCLAHAVSLERGYASQACATELARLHRMGADWVSLTPFAYLPSTRSPELYPSVGGGLDEESDEALAEAAARARALGMRVMLVPHLWTRGWVGELTLGPAGWTSFFAQYRAFILHHALLAEREGMDGLVVGHELVSATLGHPEEWRSIIADVRRAYHGTVIYGANWGDEVRGVTFWDAVDLVGVSFYEPLAARPTRSAPELRAGAAKALAALRGIAARTGRPVVLLELGYPDSPAAMVRPWDDGGAGPPDPEAQRACYEAAVAALDPEDWVAGAFWWKWFSSPLGESAGGRTFSPRGLPAEAVMARALRSWEGRPVRVLRPPAASPR